MRPTRNTISRKQSPVPRPLWEALGECPAPLTPEPDEQEIAAKALLETLSNSPSKGRTNSPASVGSADGAPPKGGRGVRYYRSIADRIAAAHQAESRAALRYVAYCEQQLAATPHKGGLGGLEVGLYRHLDTIEREGGELKRRWQHCLATVTVRLMQASETTDSSDSTD